MKKVQSTHALIRLKKYEKPPPEYFAFLILEISKIIGTDALLSKKTATRMTISTEAILDRS